MYTKENISDYMNKITEDQSIKLLNHCNKHKIAPVVSAWYDDIEDLFEDYNEHCEYTKAQTKAMLRECKNMFCKFSNGEMVKLEY